MCPNVMKLTLTATSTPPCQSHPPCHLIAGHSSQDNLDELLERRWWRRGGGGSSHPTPSEIDQIALTYSAVLFPPQTLESCFQRWQIRVSRVFGKFPGCWSSPEESGPGVLPRCWKPVQMNIVVCSDARPETLVPRYNLHIQQHKGKGL